MSARATGWILIAVSAAAFGTLGVLIEFAYQAGVDKYTALALRFSMAVAVLAVVAAIRRPPRASARTLAALFLVGGGGYVAHSFCYFTALQRASPGLVGLVFYLYPALVALGGHFIFRDRMGWARWAAVALAIAGTALTLPPPGQTGGIELAVACAWIYAAYILGCSRLTRGVDPVVSATVIIAGAAVAYVAIAFAKGAPLPPTSRGWTLVAGMALVSTALAISCFFSAMGRIGATPAAVGSTLEPLVTVGLSFLFLDERLTVLQLAGGAMIVAAVVWLATRPPASSP